MVLEEDWERDPVRVVPVHATLGTPHPSLRLAGSPHELGTDARVLWALKWLCVTLK